MDAIALRAGTNKRMLYHYFGDKEGLYIAVLEHAYQQIREAEKSLDLGNRTPGRGACGSSRCSPGGIFSRILSS